MEIGKRIRKARKALGFTQAELAEKVGVTQQTIFRWERGTRVPKSRDLVKLAQVLNTTVGISLVRLKVLNQNLK